MIRWRLKEPVSVRFRRTSLPLGGSALTGSANSAVVLIQSANVPNDSVYDRRPYNAR